MDPRAHRLSVGRRGHAPAAGRGTGTDPAPYFRVFNPVTQSTEHDPAGVYIRRWVPELATIDGKAVHEPWNLPDGPPPGYPAPIVDHAAERREALARYDAVRAAR